MSSELSGVRSSCDMFARNSDLYFEVSASCSAFSSSATRASSTSRFLSSMRVLLLEQLRLLLELLVRLLQLLLLGLEQLLGGACSDFACSSSSVFDCLSSSCCGCSSSDWLCSSCVEPCDCSSSSSVRMLARIVLSTTPIVSASCSRNVRWISLNGWKRRELDHRLHLVLEEDGRTMMLTRRAPRRARRRS